MNTTDPPTRRTSPRYIIGVFGLLTWGYAGICAFGLSKARTLLDSPKKTELLSWFTWNGYGAGALGLILLVIAWWLMRRAGMKDSRRSE